MHVFLYQTNRKPGCVTDGGYYYLDAEGQALGFGEVANADFALTVPQALGWGASLSLTGGSAVEPVVLDLDGKLAQVQVLFEAKGLTVTAGDLTSGAAEARTRMLDRVRATRNDLLLDTDWTQLADAPLSAEAVAAYAAYRQALRDLPATFAGLDNIEDVLWPVVE